VTKKKKVFWHFHQLVSQGKAVHLLMADQGVSMHEVFVAALALKRFLLAVLAMMDTKLRHGGKTFAAVTASDLHQNVVKLFLFGPDAAPE